MSPSLDRKGNEVRVKAIDNMINDTWISIYKITVSSGVIYM